MPEVSFKRGEGHVSLPEREDDITYPNALVCRIDHLLTAVEQAPKEFFGSRRPTIRRDQ